MATRAKGKYKRVYPNTNKIMFAGGNPDQDTSGYDPTDVERPPGSPNYALDYLKNFNAQTPTDQGTDTNPGEPKGSGINWGAIGAGLSKVGNAVMPYASNIANSLRRPPNPAVPNLVSPVTLSRIDLSASRGRMERAARSQDLNADRSLNEQAANSVRSANLAKTMEGEGQVSEQEAFLNARQKAEAAGMNLNVDAMNTNAMNRYNDEKTSRSLALQREQSSNLSNAADKAISIKNEQQKAALDQQKLTTLSQIWKQSGVYDRMLAKMKKEGNNDPTGIGNQMNWLGTTLDNGSGELKAMGGPVRRRVFAAGGDPTQPIVPGATPSSQPMAIQTDLNHQVNDYDLLQRVIGGGGDPLGSEYGRTLRKQQDPVSGKLIQAAQIFNQRDDLGGKSPQDRMAMFTGLQGHDPAVAAYLGRMKTTVGTNLSTPDIGVQPAVATRAFGGFTRSTARGYLNPFGNSRSIGLGPGIPRDKFNPSHVSHQQHNLLAMGGSVKPGWTDHEVDGKQWTNYGDATPDLYCDGGPMGRYPSKEYGGIGGGYRLGGPFQEEWANGGQMGSNGGAPGASGRAFDYVDSNTGMDILRKGGHIRKAPPYWNGYSSDVQDPAGSVPGPAAPMAAGGLLHSSDYESSWSNNGGRMPVGSYATGGWISKAVNPAHKGFCTPMTKSTCTPRRKAFAMTMKKHHGFH